MLAGGCSVKRAGTGCHLGCERFHASQVLIEEPGRERTVSRKGLLRARATKSSTAVETPASPMNIA